MSSVITDLAAALQAKDAAYLERNRCVALLARMALVLGLRAGLARTDIDGWSPEWHGCVYIDLPTGQVSWHYHDTDAHLFAGLPAYEAHWDGHDTPEKYRRVAGAFPIGEQAPAPSVQAAARGTPDPEPPQSLLRKPVRNITEISAQIPGGCYCPPDKCGAPVIMGRQTPCLRRAIPAVAAELMGGRESLDDALAVVESFGPGTEGLNDTYARQILLAEEVKRLRALLNTPELRDFAKGVALEAAHQRERWSTAHDAGKTPPDWFWLLGYLAGKALNAAVQGDTEKALHHTISSAAALANWHAALSGSSTAMRPGIDPVAKGIAAAAGGPT